MIKYEIFAYFKLEDLEKKITDMLNNKSIDCKLHGGMFRMIHPENLGNVDNMMFCQTVTFIEVVELK